MAAKIPYVNVLQSAICIPAPQNGEIPFALDIKILPDKNIPPEPFFGVWLLDISGSMAGKRLDNAKSSLIEQIKIIPDGSLFSLITFETDIHKIVSNVKLDDNSRKMITEKINKIQDYGTTSLYAALQKGIELLRDYARQDNNFKIKKIILISDGDPTDVQVETGDENDANYQKYFQLAKEALEYKGSIDTIGALGDHNVFLMYELAKRSTGKYIFAENADELKTKMIIATEQTVRIAFSQPSLTINCLTGNLQLQDAAQYKPTVIRMPFEKHNDQEFKSFLRSFEAGDTYQLLIKGKLTVDPKAIQMESPNNLLKLNFDFGNGLISKHDISIKFTSDASNFKLNQD
ncbi:MAG: vWA domain-containing protein, partial [Promethearchaeota archaeon]